MRRPLGWGAMAVALGLVALMAWDHVSDPVARAQTVQAYPAELRLGYVGGTATACAAATATTPAAVGGHAALLAQRLGIAVRTCGFVDEAAMVAAFSAGEVDFAPLSAQNFAGLRGRAVPILSLRRSNDLPRTPVVAVAANALTASDAPSLASRRIAVLAPGKLTHDIPRATLAAYGGGGILARPTPSLGSAAAVLTALKSGSVEVVLMPLAYWSTGCAEAKDACDGLKIAWQGMPPLERAWGLRADAPAELRYRLIGVHLPMHLENPRVFAAIGGPAGGSFEPTEATALDHRPVAGQ